MDAQLITELYSESVYQWLFLKLRGDNHKSQVLGPLIVNIVISDLDEAVQEMLIKSADDTKLGETANTLEDRNKFQKYIDRLEHRVENNRLKCNRNNRYLGGSG